MSSQNPPAHGEAYIHSRIVPSLVSPPVAIQCIAAAPRCVSSSVVPPALLHCSGSAVPFLPSKQSQNPPCCLVSALPFLSSLSAPSYSALPTSPSSLSLLFSSSIQPALLALLGRPPHLQALMQLLARPQYICFHPFLLSSRSNQPERAQDADQFRRRAGAHMSTSAWHPDRLVHTPASHWQLKTSRTASPLVLRSPPNKLQLRSALARRV